MSERPPSYPPRPAQPRQTFEEYCESERENAPYKALFMVLLTPLTSYGDTKGTQNEVTKILEETMGGLLRGLIARDAQHTKLLKEVGVHADPLRAPEVSILNQEIAKKVLGVIKPSFKKRQIASSMIDLATLGLTDPEDIRNFLKLEGYDLDDESKREELLKLFEEAVASYDKNFAPKNDKNGQIHKDLRNFKDPNYIYNVFQMEAAHEFRPGAAPTVIPGRRHLIQQARTLLRMVQTKDHRKKDRRIALLREAFEHVEGRIEKNVLEISMTKFYAAGLGAPPIRIEETQNRLKADESIDFKLMQKPSTRTHEITDGVGFRFVEETPGEALRLIFTLFFNPKTRIFSPNSIRIDATKQTLFDGHKMKADLDAGMSPKDLFNKLISLDGFEYLAEPTSRRDGNEHSDVRYTAIHIIFDDLVPSEKGPELCSIEFQFLDKASQQKHERHVKHEDYDDRKLATVKKRVVRNNINGNYRGKAEMYKKVKRRGTKQKK